MVAKVVVRTVLLAFMLISAIILTASSEEFNFEVEEPARPIILVAGVEIPQEKYDELYPLCEEIGIPVNVVANATCYLTPHQISTNYMVDINGTSFPSGILFGKGTIDKGVPVFSLKDITGEPKPGELDGRDITTPLEAFVRLANNKNYGKRLVLTQTVYNLAKKFGPLTPIPGIGKIHTKDFVALMRPCIVDGRQRGVYNVSKDEYERFIANGGTVSNVTDEGIITHIADDSNSIMLLATKSVYAKLCENYNSTTSDIILVYIDSDDSDGMSDFTDLVESEAPTTVLISLGNGFVHHGVSVNIQGKPVILTSRHLLNNYGKEKTKNVYAMGAVKGCASLFETFDRMAVDFIAYAPSFKPPMSPVSIVKDSGMQVISKVFDGRQGFVSKAMSLGTRNITTEFNYEVRAMDSMGKSLEKGTSGAGLFSRDGVVGIIAGREGSLFSNNDHYGAAVITQAVYNRLVESMKNYPKYVSNRCQVDKQNLITEITDWFNSFKNVKFRSPISNEEVL